jgi:predicted dehydrogenase
MRAVVASGAGVAVVVADADDATAAAAASEIGAEACPPDTIFTRDDLDGIVIATPSALHADQARQALAAGLAVFCQKPLGRTAAECAEVVAAAESADLLLGVDLSYRHLAATTRLRDCVSAGEIGDVFAVDLVFHNAYGPDKAWFRDPALSGGGCVIDLGTHLVDLVTWVLGADVDGVDSRLLCGGQPLLPENPAAPDDGAPTKKRAVEDYAVARLDVAGGAVATLACSWYLPAGCDAIIGATFYGTEGALAVHNVSGSFYDFTLDLNRGTRAERLVEPPDAWGGRAAVSWAQQLRGGARFDPEAHAFVRSARVIDRIYGR